MEKVTYLVISTEHFVVYFHHPFLYGADMQYVTIENLNIFNLKFCGAFYDYPSSIVFLSSRFGIKVGTV